MNEVEKDTIMKFPCQFPIKVMGKVSDDFDIVVGNIVRKHAPELSKNAVKSKLSNAGNYIAVTITIEAKSREQLDDIYLDLTNNDKVLMAL